MQLQLLQRKPDKWRGAPGALHSYRVHGLELESDLPCPGLPSGGDREPDLRLLLGEVPDSLPDATDSGYKFEARPGSLLLKTRRIADFLVRDGDEILTEIKPDCRAAEFHNLLMGWALGALLHQRDTFPLHGAALARDGRGMIVCGESGSGKSTVAYGLMARGYRLLDDNLVVPVPDGDSVLVNPGQPAFKLTGDHLTSIGVEIDEHSPMDPDGRKYTFDADASFAESPALIDRLFILSRGSGAEIEMMQLTGAEKVHALAEQTFNPHFLRGLGKVERHFGHVLDLAGRLRCHRVLVPQDDNFPEALLDRLESIGNR